MPAIEQFTWKDLLDFYSCTECGRCQDALPGHQHRQAAEPPPVIHDVKLNLLANGRSSAQGGPAGRSLPLIGERRSAGTVGEDALWACTTCGACMVCPVFIEHVPKIVKMRRHLVENEAEFPDGAPDPLREHRAAVQPGGSPPASGRSGPRTWTSPPRGRATLSTCSSSAAPAPSTPATQDPLAVVKILHAAGVSWGILGTDEKCCGDTLRRLGNEYVFDRWPRRTWSCFKKQDVTKIITHCPHCFTTLKNDYRQFGLEALVVHHSELLNDLLEPGSLHSPGSMTSGRSSSTTPATSAGTTTSTTSPASSSGGHRRQAVRDSTGRHRASAAAPGGGRMWMEESPAPHQPDPRPEALAKNPDTIAVACPYCMTMFEDGLKDEKASKVRVADIAEILASRIAGN